MPAKNLKTNNYVVYKHTTPSGKVYIGITRQTIYKRWKNGKGYEGCTAFYRAIQKYGWDAITHEIVFTDLDHDTACEKEQELIDKYKSHIPEFGYNLTLGGENYEPNEEWRVRASEAHKKYYREHPEARAAISQNQKGRKISEEQKQAIRESILRYFNEHPEHRAECGNGVRGKKRSEEFCKALGERKSKKVMCVETGRVYKSILEASEDLRVHRTAITNVLHGRGKTCCGYTFKFT